VFGPQLRAQFLASISDHAGITGESRKRLPPIFGTFYAYAGFTKHQQPIEGKKMIRSKTEVTNLQYNAATQSFEALVAVHTLSGPVTYATSAHGPMDTSFKEVSKALTK
jgi:hypothetical protein